jgi:hypothetical protein
MEADRMPATRYRPGHTVPVSGVYKVVDIFRVGVGREITCEEGDAFPPTAYTDEYGFVLVRESAELAPLAAEAA